MSIKRIINKNQISAFGQHVDANGQINFAGADMAGSSYLPNEAVFLPASMASAEAFNQPDLPPLADQKTKTNQNKPKGKKSKQPPPTTTTAEATPMPDPSSGKYKQICLLCPICSGSKKLYLARVTFG